MAGASVEERKEFIKKIALPAQRSEIKYGILSSITIAQAILESGWGQSELAVNANNLFGIKAQRGEDAYTKETTEYKADGTTYKVTADFRKYGTWQDSVEDHGKFLLKSLYNEVREANDYEQAAWALQHAGYAGDSPDYAKYLIRLIEEYGLQAFDDPEYCPDCGKRLRPCPTCGH